MELERRDEIRPYEAVIMLHPDSTEDEQKTLFKKNKAIVEQFKGEVNHLDTWGKRNLGNSISKLRKAVYFHTTFKADPSAVAELERTMRINDRVLRFQHTRLEDGTDLLVFVENFKKSLAESAAREREREAKFQARKAAQGPRGPRRGDDDEGPRGPRGPRPGGFDRGDRGGGFDRGGSGEGGGGGGQGFGQGEG